MPFSISKAQQGPLWPLSVIKYTLSSLFAQDSKLSGRFSCRDDVPYLCNASVKCKRTEETKKPFQRFWKVFYQHHKAQASEEEGDEERHETSESGGP